MTPEVSSKLYFVNISQVSERLWLFNHRRADFVTSKFWDFFRFSVSLTIEKIIQNTVVIHLQLKHLSNGWGCKTQQNFDNHKIFICVMEELST